MSELDELIAQDAKTLMQEFSKSDPEVRLRRVLAALRASDHVRGPADTDDLGVSRASALDDVALYGCGDDVELAACMQRAEKGDAASARRVAELLEGMNNESEAAVWWRRAADAGDPDAIAYIETIT